MKKFPFFADLKERAGQGKKSLNEIRNNTLQSATSIRYSGWNKANLCKAILSRSSKYYCICIFEIIQHDQSLSILLSSGEKIALGELFSWVSQADYSANFCFLHCDAKLMPALLSCKEIRAFPKSLVVLCDKDEFSIFFALACEIVNWWMLESVYASSVQFLQVARAVLAVLANLRACLSEEEIHFELHENLTHVSGEAWSDGRRYATTVDIEKFRMAARVEQIDDAIKRLLDCASHPRSQHMSTTERLICSQGLFWLAEIANRNDVKDWIFETRFFKELAPERSEAERNLTVLRARAVDDEVAETLLQNFVRVPAGHYQFGIAYDAIGSEPPAKTFSAFLPEFFILSTLVTIKLWAAIVDDVLKGEDDYPVVSVNFFEAEQYGRLLEAQLQRLKPRGKSNLRIRLPTEYQWEAAARGEKGLLYPWGKVFEEARCNCAMKLGQPSSVYAHSPAGDSPFGCRDMAGNAREWTRSYAGTRGVDWTEHETSRLTGDLVHITSRSRMVIRGGSYSYAPECVQTWVRNSQLAERKDRQTGFRLVMEIEND